LPRHLLPLFLDLDRTTLVGAGLWLAAVAVAFAGQLLFASQQPGMAALVDGLAIALIVGAARFLGAQPAAPAATVTSPPLSLTWRTQPVLLALGTAALAGLVALVLSALNALPANTPPALFVDPRTPHGQAFWSWLLSLGALTAAALLAAGPIRLPALPRPSRRTWAEIGLVAFVLVVALVFRLPALSAIPPEVHGDEGAVGLHARRVLTGQDPSLFWLGWAGIPNLSYAIPAAFMAVFGDNLFGLRVASVVQGALSILLTYLVVRRFWGWRVATLAGLLLAAAHWHIHFSRNGISYMQALFIGLLFLWFLLRGLERGRPVDFLAAGFAAAACLELYYAARLAPVIGAVYVAFRAATETGFLRRHAPGLAVLVLGTVAFFAPMSGIYWADPAPLLSRTGDVVITYPGVSNHLKSVYGVDSMVGVLWHQTVNALLAFNYRGETSMQYGHMGPGATLVDFWSGPFLVLGIGLVTAFARERRAFLAASWFWLTIAAGIVTADALFSPRVLLLAPTLFVAAALAVDVGWRAAGRLFGRSGVGAFAACVGVLLILVGRENYDQYFRLHAQVLQPAGLPTSIARYVDEVGDRYRVFWFAEEGGLLRYDSAAFLAPDIDAVDVGEQPLALPLDRVPRGKGAAFLFADGQEPRLEEVRGVYPGGTERQLLRANGVPLFKTYLVEHQQLLAARPDARIDDARIPALRPAELD
jgi:4-amino-4-deoxy-L-arabinose transferase-like glycosyltransferase